MNTGIIVFALMTIEASLLLSLPISFLLFKIFQKYIKTNIKVVLTLSLIFLLLVISFYSSKWSFINIEIDILIIAVLYFVYNCALVLTLLINKKILKIAMLSFLAVPVIFGYIFAVGGWLGLLLVLGDIAPMKKVTINQNYSYQVNNYGNATTSYGGRVIAIYKTNKMLPIERKITSFDIEDSEIPPSIIDSSKIQIKVVNDQNFNLIISNSNRIILDKMLVVQK